MISELSPVLHALRRALAILGEHGKPYLILAEDEAGNLHRATSGSLPWVLGAMEIVQDDINDSLERRRTAEADTEEERDGWQKGLSDESQSV